LLAFGGGDGPGPAKGRGGNLARDNHLDCFPKGVGEFAYADLKKGNGPI